MTAAGVDPKNKDVVLTRGGDFNYSMPDEGATAWTILFDDTAASTWAATVAGGNATWAQDKAITDPMPEGTTVRWRTNADVVAYVGRVTRRAVI